MNFFFDRRPIKSLDEAVDLYGLEEFQSATRSTVPLLSLLKQGNVVWANLLRQIGAADRTTEAHLEFTVGPKQGRGKPSHTDVMLISEDRAIAVEAKWTEPRYDEVGIWLGQGSGAQNRRDVMNGWLSLLQPHANKNCCPDDFGSAVYQMVHRAASACSEGLTTVMGVVGAVLGGAGIAALGGAIGVPLAILLAPLGYLAGTELDSLGIVHKVLAYLRSNNGTVPDPLSSPADLEELAGLVASLADRCEKAEATSQRVSEQIESLRDDSTLSPQESPENIEGLRQKLTELGGRVDALAFSVGVFREQGQTAAQESRGQIESLRASADDLEKKVSSSSSRVLECRSDVSALKRNLHDLEASIASYMSEVLILRKRVMYGAVALLGIVVLFALSFIWYLKR